MKLLKSLFTATLIAAATAGVNARDYANWMAELPDQAYVSTLSLPGAHDAATGEGFTLGATTGSSAQAQTKSLNDIINSGVRVLDFRPAVDGSRLRCYHGVAATKKYFDDALKDLCSWLNQHPTEFFILHLYSGNNNGNINDKMNELLNNDAVKGHLIQFRADLTVAEMRGKILFMVRDAITWNSPYATKMENWYETDNLSSGWELRGRVYETRPGTSDRYDRRITYLLIQDLAHSNGDNMNEKKKFAKQIFDFLENRCPTTHNNMVWTFNFASAYNDKNSSSAVGYADNANTMNPYFMECLNASNGPAGMVMIDFVGADTHNVYKNLLGSTSSKTTYGDQLVKAVVEQNFKYINDFVDRQPTGVSFVNHSWSGVLWDHMFYGNNLFADVNGNGLMDYVIATSQSDNGTVFFTTNNGNGGFNFMTERVFGTNYGNHVLAPIDFNNDGKLDFIVLKSGRAEMQQNLGDGQFRKIENIGIEGTVELSENSDFDGNRVYNFEGNIVVLDLNHDGIKDVVAFDSNHTPQAFIGNGDGTFTPTDTNLPKLQHGQMAIGDYDRDGFADILISGILDNGEENKLNNLGISIVLTRPDLNFEVLTPSSLQQYATYDGGVMLVDMNMDGWLDVFVSGLRNPWDRYDSHLTKLLINQGGDWFEPADVLLDAVRKGNADWADLTGNGRPDIVYAGENHIGYCTSTVLNVGQDSYKAESSMDGHRASPSVAACDYRGVGRASVAVMGHSWDASNNQLFDTEVVLPARIQTYSATGTVNAQAELKPATDEDEPGVVIAVKNADEMPSGTRYNYVLQLKDGKIIANVPVNPTTGTALTADVNAATTATQMTYPRIKLDDVKAIGIQTVGADKTASALTLSSNGITTALGLVRAECEDAPTEYYDLQGRRIEKPSTGICIIRKGTVISKVAL